jgi:hypothetical protein
MDVGYASFQYTAVPHEARVTDGLRKNRRHSVKVGHLRNGESNDKRIAAGRYRGRRF